MFDLSSKTKEELEAWLLECGEKRFRAAQIFDWIHKKHATSFDSMTNLSASLRENLRQKAILGMPEILEERISAQDDTRKYLMRLWDGNIIESVLMRYSYGLSVCISSQVGCRMGCRFCASTLDGLVRNLSAGEMLGQIYRIQEHIGERISHVVVMGSGEPLDNYENFIRFLTLTDIGHRNITASTCGIVPRMYDLANEKTGITLAVSLHAPTDEMRRQIMPVANRFSLEEICEACRYFFEKTGRRVTWEYSLIRGMNDTPACAEALARLAGKVGAHVNLIPVNPVKERNYQEPYRRTVSAFAANLERYGINVTIRREMGRDISGACGQLRRHYKDEHESSSQN